MKLIDLKKMSLILVFLLAFQTKFVGAQGQGMDAILPPDHLLENLPWMGEDGKVDSKGLFDFEDIRGEGHKDLILIYRQSAPLTELEKPHNQTLVVCFYDQNQQKYIKNFEDDGGTIQWVRLLTEPGKKVPSLILQRDDLNGNQVLEGFDYINGNMKQVLQALAPQIFVKFQDGEIWCSSKDFPKDKESAEHVFSWDEADTLYKELKPSPGGASGWTGSAIAVVPTPIEAAKLPESSAKMETVVKATHPSKNGWWDEPLDPQTACTKLDSELVPQLLKKNEMVTLGQKAKGFFAELQKQKVPTKQINGYRASYYAAVAATLLDLGNKKNATYYYKIASSFQSDNPDVMALKGKIIP